MVDVYELYEKRIQKRVIKAVKDLEKKRVSAVARGEEADPLKVLAEYLLEVTHIVIEECGNDEDALRRIIPRYLPDGITLDDVQRREDQKPKASSD